MTQNTVNMEAVIGIGSLAGWTRGHYHDELRQIREKIKGKCTMDEWEAMGSTLANLYACCGCSKMQEYVYAFWRGSFANAKEADHFGFYN